MVVAAVLDVLSQYEAAFAQCHVLIQQHAKNVKLFWIFIAKCS